MLMILEKNLEVSEKVKNFWSVTLNKIAYTY